MKKTLLLVATAILTLGTSAAHAADNNNTSEKKDSTECVCRKVKEEVKKDFKAATDGTVKVYDKTKDGTVKIYNKVKDGTVNTFNKVKDKVTQ